jgi:hypothetical protein
MSPKEAGTMPGHLAALHAAIVLIIGALVLFLQTQQLAAIKMLVHKDDGRKRGWEYKVVEVENFDKYMEQAAFEETLTNAPSGLDHSRDANNSQGEFHLDGGSQMGKYGADLYQLGMDGWELVAAVPQEETVAGAEYYDGDTFNTTANSFDKVYKKFNNVRTGRIILILKR